MSKKQNSEATLHGQSDAVSTAGSHSREHHSEGYASMVAEIRDYAILSLSLSGEILNWNAGAEFIKGYRADEIVGKHFRIFYTQQDAKHSLPEKFLAEAVATGRAVTEGWRIRKDGSRFWASVVITALHDHSGNVIGFTKVTRDLTERKNSEDHLRAKTLELELKNMELERLNGDLSSFAYVVSHDLKEPLRKIQIFAGKSIEETSAERQKVYTAKILSSAQRMQALMDDLIAYAQMTTNNQAFSIVDLNQVVDAVRIDLEEMILETNATIVSSVLPHVNGLQFQFHQLFLNLIANAVKFAKPDHAPLVRITSTLVSETELPDELIINGKKYYCISVSDNGIGFAQSNAENIFNLFQRLDPSKDKSGTGIGLSIVKRIAQNHDGFVRAESSPGQGATFHIFIPVN